MKFRKQPVVIDAYQTPTELFIPTLEGVMHAEAGDWIITGVHGEQYPCKPDIFLKTYEPADLDRNAWVVWQADASEPELVGVFQSAEAAWAAIAGATGFPVVNPPAGDTLTSLEVGGQRFMVQVTPLRD